MAAILLQEKIDCGDIDIGHDENNQLYIEGIFAQADKLNGNRRIYEHRVLEDAMDVYIADYVNKNRGLGELNHPNKRPFADPKEAAILTKSLHWDGSNVVGKAIVLNTPNGNIVRGLLEGGFNMGVSTRALGTVRKERGINYVNPDLTVTAIDCVDDPSGPDCYVNAVNESVEWELNESNIWVPIVNRALHIDDNQQLFEDRIKRMTSYLRKS